MQKRKGFKNIYNRICDLLSIRNMSWMALILFIILMIPVCYLSFVNRASGDDYGYGAYTRVAWLTSHSLWEVIKAACYTIEEYYYSWQGTWFSIFLFAFQPEVFSNQAYVIVTLLMLFLWIGSTALLFKEILLKKLRLDKWSVRLITLLFLLIGIQFIPSTKSAIFWYNGCAHYLIPFAMGQFLICLLIRYVDEPRSKNFVSICIIMALLGGSNYQAALFALIVTAYAAIYAYLKRKRKRAYCLLLPILLETIGLGISITAPGNKIRGGKEFGFSLLKVSETIGLSFMYGIKDIANYLREKPLVFIGAFLLLIISIVAFMQRENCNKIEYPVIKMIALYCLYSAMQAPALYAGVDVSGGVFNMNFQVFLLFLIGIIVVVSAQISSRWKSTEKVCIQKIVVPGLLAICCLIVIFRSNMKDTTSYVCLTYITSGQATDYKQQMKLQTMLLEEDTEHVVLPFINDVQGPLMHMPVTENPESWTNKIACEFYGKKSVVAIPRPEWNELYGEKMK